VYESIDELIGRYIEPMNDNVDAAMNHRKFLDRKENDVDEKLKEMKRAAPKGFYYQLCWSDKYPGSFTLRYIRTATPRYHRIEVTPDGYNWRTGSGSKRFDKIDLLLNAFKKNPTGMPPQHHSQKRAESSRGESQSTAIRASTSQNQSRWSAQPPSTSQGWGAPATASARAGVVTHPEWRPTPPALPPPPVAPPVGHPPPPPGPPPTFAPPPGGPPPGPPPPGPPPPGPPPPGPPPPGGPPPGVGFPFQPPPPPGLPPVAVYPPNQNR